MKAMNLVAWGLVVILAIGAGVLAFVNYKHAANAAALRDTLSQTAQAIGVADVTPLTLKNPATYPDVITEAQAKAAELNMEIVRLKDALTAAQSEAATAKGEAAAQSQKNQEQAAQIESLKSELTAKTEELSAARREAEKSLQEVREALEKQKAEGEKALAESEARRTEAVARLEAEVESLKAALAAAATLPAPAEESPDEKTPAVSAPSSALQPAVAVGQPAEEDWEKGGEVLGESKMFSVIAYSYPDKTLYLRLGNGQKLVYPDIPRRVFESWISGEKTLDMSYRFNIQGKYSSLPPDSVVIRKFWQDARRKNYGGDVRLVKIGAPRKERDSEVPAEEEAPEKMDEETGEEAPAEMKAD